MRNSYLTLYIKYVDGNDKTRLQPIRYTEVGTKCDNANSWFYSFASQFKNQNNLATAALDLLYETRLKHAKNKEKYAKNHRQRFVIKELLGVELTIKDRYVEREYSPIKRSTADFDSYQLPILYRESYYGKLDKRRKHQLVEKPSDLSSPLVCLKRTVLLFSKQINAYIEDKNNSDVNREKALGFRQNILIQVASFLSLTLERIKNGIEYDPRYSDYNAGYQIDRINDALRLRHDNVEAFINEVLFNNRYNVLLYGNGNTDQNKYLIFVVNLINQIQANEIANYLDNTGYFINKFTEKSYLNTDLCKELVNKSMNELYNKKIKDQQVKLLKEYDEIKDPNKEVYQELYDEYKSQYPDMDDEFIHDLIQPDHEESESNGFTRK